MNILMLCFEYPPLGGGGGIGVRQYAEAWAAKGHRVAVLTGGGEGLPAREALHGVEIVRVPTLARRDRATATTAAMLTYNLSGLLHVFAHLGRLREFDIVNTHFSIPTGPLGWAASRLLGRPDVLTIIGGDIYDPTKRSSPHRSRLLRQVNAWIINAADRVVAISSDTKTRAERFYRIRAPIRVINYGFTPAAGSSDGEEPVELPEGDRFRLISVGRLVARKGFDHLLRAMSRLPEDVELLLVGDGPLEPELRALARAEGVEERVRFLGYRTREAIHALLRHADCYVLSSLHEGLGIVVQEAMDAGLPVVATDNGGQVDLIRSRRNGLLVPPGDPVALAEAIRVVRDDPALAETMRRNNLADIRELHMESNCELYLDLFRELLAPADARPSVAS
ncbi:MAG: glycosyltransferase family 4 protein [Gemmatimonadota bacterium]